jgi:hypothetical protein
MLWPMTPMLTLATLVILAREPIEEAEDVAFATWVIESASLTVADEAGHLDWIDSVAPVAANPRAILIAQGLAKRTYRNHEAIVAEGGVGPIGGDRFVEDYARTLELTEVEREVLQAMRPDGGSNGNSLFVQTTENIPNPISNATIYLPDLDPRAQAWPVGTEGVDDWAYTPLVP